MASLTRGRCDNRNLRKNILYPVVKFGDQDGLMLLGPFALGNVAYHSREHSPSAHRRLADGKLHRKDRAIFVLAGDLPSKPDDFGSTGCEVISQVRIVLTTVRFRHQHFDIAS